MVEEELIKKTKSLLSSLTDRIVPIESLVDSLVADIRFTIKEYRKHYRDISSNKEKYRLMEDSANIFLPQFITQFERHIKEVSKSFESQVLLYRMIGDYKRYLVEFNENFPEKKSFFIQESLIAYKEAMTLCDQLEVDNYTRLATTLNFIVLLADEMREIDEAISLAENTINSVKEKELDGDKLEIIRLLKENLEYFKQNRNTYLTDTKLS